MTDEVDVYL